MEKLQDLQSQLESIDTQTAILATIGLGTLVFAYLLLRTDAEAPVPYHIAAPPEIRDGWKGEVLTKPSLKIPGSNDIQCYAPATGEAIGRITPASREDVDEAIGRAQRAQEEWKKTTFSQRRRVLRTMLQFVLENQDLLSRVACLDSGKTLVDAALGEVLVTAEKLAWTLKHGEAALRPSRRPTSLLMLYKRNEIIYEPLGVVAACVSWNYPFHNLISPIISSIFAGNAIVVKGSEATAWSSRFFVQVAREAIRVCGHDPEIVQNVSCWPDVADHLTSHSGIAHITFIGSRPVAHAVCASAAKALTPVVVELGGKDPALLLDDLSDADVRRVASILMRGTFQSAGQNCIGLERAIALPGVYEKLIATVEPLIRELQPGSALNADPNGAPIDIGASISDANFANLERLIADAVAQGARCLVGGKRYNHPEYPSGSYFTPTLIVDVTEDMEIAQTELFAPVFLAMRAPDLTTAIALANSSPYALGASVWGNSKPALERVVRDIHAGMIAVNDFGVTYLVQLPFGGVKGSGYGRFAGKEGLRGVCNAKSVCRDRLDWLGVRTSIPPPMDIPLGRRGKGAGRVARRMAEGIVWVGYGWDWRGKVRGLRALGGF